jgi:hypothetical protein
MNGRLLGMAVVVSAVLAVGCGSSSDTPAGGTPGGGTAASGSCSVATSHFCIDYSGVYPGSLSTACAGAGGTYSTSACATAGRVGSCTNTTSGFTQAIRWYPPITAAIGASACTAPNVWTPG